jgi:hypothetical protein
MINTEASAVIGPTPKCVISRIAPGRFLASRSTAAVNSSIVGFILSSKPNNSCRRRLAQGPNASFSNCARPHGSVSDHHTHQSLPQKIKSSESSGGNLHLSTSTLTTLNPKSSAQQVKTPTTTVKLVDRLLDQQGLRPGGSARSPPHP